jgi:hypothetical protein
MANSVDFRSNQIQTGRLIVASGSGQSSNCLVVYSINADGSPVNQGIIDPTQFNTASIGTDTFFFVSGTIGDRGTINPTVSVFGGDLHISGNLTIDGTYPNSTTMGHSWERPDPLAAGVGATFINTDDGSEYVSSGTAATDGVPLSGWMRRLPSGMAPTRAGLRSSNAPTIVLAVTTNKIMLAPYATNSCTFAMHYYWNANTAAIPYYIDLLLNYGLNTSFSDGAAAFYYQAGGKGPIYIALHTNGASTYVGSAVPAVAGYNTLVFAPVSYGGNHYWRWSYNGSVAADTLMTNPYVGPSAYNYFQAWGRGDNGLYFGGKGIDLAAWNTLLTGADMAILSNPPAGTYGLLETANTGPATIRIEANRFDPRSGVAPNNGNPLQSMPIRGSNNPANVYELTEKVNLP